MKLSPLDIRKQEFARTFRGFDVDEVQAFLQMVSTQWDEMLGEHRRLEQKVREVEARLEHYAKVEEALQEALRTARESSRQALENARQKAENLVAEAEMRAGAIKQEAEREKLRIKQEVASLTSRRDEIAARLRAFLTSEIELLGHYDAEMPADAEAPVPVEGAALQRGRSETSSFSAGRTGQRPAPQPEPARARTEGNRQSIPLSRNEPEPQRQAGFAGNAAFFSGVQGKPDAPLEEEVEEAEAGESDAEKTARSGGSRWTVHPVVSSQGHSSRASGEPSEQEASGSEPSEASSQEIERIRRILKDLD